MKDANAPYAEDYATCITLKSAQEGSWHYPAMPMIQISNDTQWCIIYTIHSVFNKSFMISNKVLSIRIK